MQIKSKTTKTNCRNKHFSRSGRDRESLIESKSSNKYPNTITTLNSPHKTGIQRSALNKMENGKQKKNTFESV